MTATKLEVLLAIASSEFHKTTHVHYMPVGKEFTTMLRNLRASACIEPLNENYYTLTKKGWNYVRKHSKVKFKDVDAQIDKFVDDLP
jgi:hypothetical protein